VKLAIVSDVHANLPALQAVLADIAEVSGVHRVLCLGDAVGYGASPNECCELLREVKATSVRGNHDRTAIEQGREEWFTPQARACILWTREKLEERNRRMLASLPEVREVERVTLCHGSLVEPDDYVYSWTEALPSFARLSTHVGFLGHSHYAAWYYYEADPPRGDGEMMPLAGTIKVKLDGGYLINPGAVGQPRDGNPAAAYVLYDDQLEEVRFRRVEYDIEAAAAAIVDAGLPMSMAARLFSGM
jgi:predicted phosphodiesterase